MGFTDARQFKKQLRESAHATLNGFEVRVEQEQFVFHVETSVADGLTDKAHNYILQNMEDRLFSNDSVGIQRKGEQNFVILVGPEDTIPNEDCEVIRDPSLPKASPIP